MLEGTWAADCYFRGTPPRQHLPVLLALAGVWNVDSLGVLHTLRADL